MQAIDTLGGVEIRALRKHFGETKALDGLELTFPNGQVTGVAGPNGAGKSTMVRILAGELPADSGEVIVEGLPWTPAAGATQVAVVHQEPQLFPNLSTIDNLLVGREGVRARKPRAGPVEHRLMEQFGIASYSHRLLGDLPIGVQQRVEIVRALVRNARVVLFDEPNSALTEQESAELFSYMHQLAAEGRAVVLVSHRLEDLATHAREVAVILDGRRSTILAGAQLTEANLARAITVTGGRAGSKTDASTTGGDGLALRDWTHAGRRFGPVELRASSGEIIAVVGVEGSGAREFVRSIGGFEPATGLIETGRQAGAQMIRRRTGYVPPDRRAALFFNFTIGQNIVSRLWDPISDSGLKSEKRARMIAFDWIRRMRIKARGPDSWARDLSGGNQQKVLIAAAMAPNPPVLILEEPTRGVDIGSKREIYLHLREYASDGAVVLLFCTELNEVFEVADRVYVMARGQLSAPRSVADFGDEKDLAVEVARLTGDARLGRGDRRPARPADSQLARG